MRALAREWHAAGETIGLVPTMGALHRGHMSLVAAARAETSRVVVSVFVNPLQFGPDEDFERYPRPVEADLAMLRDAGVDAVYMPERSALYPPGTSTRVRVGGVTETLEGVHRPGHFEGVATVVTKLFWAVDPDRAYFGQKDAQQVAVVTRLAADLDSGVEIRVCPTVRDADGLAVSSRNAYLSPSERAAALSLSRSLRTAAEMYALGERDPGRLRARIHEVLAAEPLARIDYAELVDPSTFQAPGMLAVLAVRIGKTRLIDNHDVSKPFLADRNS
jgi:pantoate--beta-alanine ligase